MLNLFLPLNCYILYVIVLLWYLLTKEALRFCTLFEVETTGLLAIATLPLHVSKNVVLKTKILR